MYSGQVEKHTSDGTVEVSFPDGAVRVIQTDGTEKWTFPDGMVAQTFTNGDKILALPNGQREIHTKTHKVNPRLTLFSFLAIDFISPFLLFFIF